MEDSRRSRHEPRRLVRSYSIAALLVLALLGPAVWTGCGSAPSLGSGGGGEASASTTSGGTDCGPGVVKCGSTCVDTQNDPAHCGDCATACGTDEVCSAGKCGLTCLGGATKCGASCVDMQNDPAHCGDCATACGAGQVCAGGKCGLTCLGGATKCGASCVDTQNDPAHCGDCTTACGAGEVCSAGKCGLTCLGGATKCGASCVETQNDPAHCGDCTTACGAGQVCAGGTCALTCLGGATKCGTSCVDTLNDASNCGGCGNDCLVTCSDVTECPLCYSGTCICDTGSTGKCSGVCVNFETDPNNCGDCGVVCGSHGTCFDYGCQCDTGFSDCGSGCVDVTSDTNNCGSCGVVCETDGVCVNSACVPSPGTINLTASPASGTAGSSALTVGSAAGFSAGQEVLIHQTQGTGAGTWEQATIASVAGSVLTLTAPLSNTFASAAGTNNHAQVVVIERYTTLDVPAGTSLLAPVWNGSTGGILAVHVTGAMTVEGRVSMAGRGYRGTGHPCTSGGSTYACQDGFSGESPIGPGSQGVTSNGPGGGGGARGQDCGMGAAGSHGTAGQNGTNNTGGNCSAISGDSPAGTIIGAPDLTAAIYFGGAGGEGGADEDGAYPGKGGNGGGIIFIKAGTLQVTGRMTVDGNNGGAGIQSAACGGGGCGMSGGGAGAGGAVRIIATMADLGSGLVTSNGGTGGTCTCGSSGAAGGQGRIAVQAGTVTGTTNPTLFGG